MQQNLFETTFKRKKTRQRFYSSMNYDEYYLLYGPPAPITKPMQDPTQDIPPLDLEQLQFNQEQQKVQQLPELQLGQPGRLQTILQIDGSQNQTHTLFKSPKFQINQRRPFKQVTQEYQPKQFRIRNRSQSDNSEYLIFNFLERVNQTGKKKIKLQ